VSYLEQLFNLEGRQAVVTGASRGLGNAMASALAQAGAHVHLVGSVEKTIQAAATTLQEAGLAATGWQADLSTGEGVSELVSAFNEKLSELHILVNNAGIGEGHPMEDYPDELWDRTLQINLTAPFQMARGLLDLMKDHGKGSVINTTSICAERGLPANPAYMAAKGGLKMLTKSMAADLAKYPVRVNAIGPGYFRTEMTAQSWADPERRQSRSDRTLLGRWGVPEDLAGAVVFLASDASSYMTGQDLYIDGGWLAKGL
jgi:NAD(P)-dependent dehydrogenase (short-subunit alcohol dehydrogenase family)